MSLNWFGEQAEAELRKAAANGLIRAATMFENQMSQRVSTPNPPPYKDSSKPGEYPRLRTGEGQRALTRLPTEFGEVMRVLRVQVGFVAGKAHLLILEMKRGRLGLQKTLEDLKPILSKLATAEFKK